MGRARGGVHRKPDERDKAPNHTPHRKIPSRESPILTGKTEHVVHRVKAGFLALSPARGGERAPCENHAVFGAMGQLDPLEGSGQRHNMVANHGAAAQGGETDPPVISCAGRSLAPSALMA